MDLLGTVETHLATVFIYFSCNGVEIVYVASNESDPVAVLGEKSTKKEMAFQQAVDMQTVLLEVRLRCRSTSTCQEQKKRMSVLDPSESWFKTYRYRFRYLQRQEWGEQKS